MPENITLFDTLEPDAGSTADVFEEIRTVYRNYPHPWVIGYSGGKDSTTVLQMVWYALAELPREELTKPVHVISTDTLVETPVIVDYITQTLDLIGNAAEQAGLPFQTHRLTPQLEDSFWVNLIGRGYPAPGNNFRWCTDRLKIKPSNRFILEQVAQHGEVILVLGVRRGESATRDQVINMHRVRGHQLARHGQLPGAWVYMPIEHFDTDDVWSYLLQSPSPWGGDNRSLAAIYRTAQSGECPLVIDKSTPSCGNSRFGCWTCTVVARDRSMQAMIDNGEEWLEPLLDFRDWLSSTQSSEDKHAQREYRGRDGRIKITDGKIRYRTYTLRFCQEILRRLLETQKRVWQHDASMNLISEEELRLIRRIWLAERQDWEDSLPNLYEKAIGRSLTHEVDDVAAPGQFEGQLLDSLCQQYDAPTKLVQKLIDAEREHHGMRRRASIHTTIDKIMREDWRTLEQALDDVNGVLITTSDDEATEENT